MTPTVYFTGTLTGPVKIGYTVHLNARMAALQTSSPEPIILFASLPGSRKAESYFHSLFSKQRISGEWFSRSSELVSLIERVNEWGDRCLPEVYREFAPAVVNAPDTNDIIASCREWIQFLAQPLPFGERMGSTLERVAADAGVSYRTLKSIWYGECRSLKVEVYVGLKERFDQKMASRLAVAIAPELRN